MNIFWSAVTFSVKVQIWTQFGAESAFQSFGSKGLSQDLQNEILSYWKFKWLRWISFDLKWNFQSKSRFGLNLEQNLHSRVLDPKDYLRIYKMKFYHIGNLSDGDKYLSICSEIFSQSPDLDSIWRRICIPEFWIQMITSELYGRI